MKVFPFYFPEKIVAITRVHGKCSPVPSEDPALTYQLQVGYESWSDDTKVSTYFGDISVQSAFNVSDTFSGWPGFSCGYEE
jgi:hypothetical protein